MKKFLLLIAVAAVCLFTASCSKTPEDMMVGKFKITEITSDQNMSDDDRAVWDEAMEELKANSSYEHKKDHKLICVDNNLERRGTWELLGGDLQLQYTFEGKAVVKSNIKEITDSYFITSNRDETGTTTTITYTKTKE